MTNKTIRIKIMPPHDVLSGSGLTQYEKARDLEITATDGYLMLRAVVEAITHYQALTERHPSYLVLGFEQYKPFIAECHAYFGDKAKVIDEIVLLGIKLKIVLLPSTIGVHISGDVADVFEYCAQKELYP